VHLAKNEETTICLYIYIYLYLSIYIYIYIYIYNYREGDLAVLVQVGVDALAVGEVVHLSYI